MTNADPEPFSSLPFRTQPQKRRRKGRREKKKKKKKKKKEKLQQGWTPDLTRSRNHIRKLPTATSAEEGEGEDEKESGKRRETGRPLAPSNPLFSACTSTCA